MIKIMRCGLLMLCALVAVSGFAVAGSLDLIGAKHSGLVGETSDGLVAAVLPNPSPEVSGLVAATNAARLEVYKDTAAKQNIPLTDVRHIAAEKLYGLAGVGEFIEFNGAWIQKK